MHIRQGDLTLTREGPALSTATPTPQTLAIGEESGHSHVLDCVLVEGLTLIDVPEVRGLRIEGQPWRHEPIPVPPGRYRVSVQRELSEAEEVVRVAD